MTMQDLILDHNTAIVIEPGTALGPDGDEPLRIRCEDYGTDGMPLEPPVIANIETILTQTGGIRESATVETEVDNIEDVTVGLFWQKDGETGWNYLEDDAISVP